VRKRLILTLGAVVVVIATAAAAVAAMAAARSADEARQRALSASPLVTGSAGGGCRTGFDTQTATNIPPDDSTTDNVPAGSVTMTKSCNKLVVGLLTTEVSTPNAGDFIHMDMRATCIGTGGFASHCVVGTQFFASPGHSFLQNGVAALHIEAVQMVWPSLAPGQWRFEALPGGNNSANLQFRSFVVQAY
jgi:hypothetical protein